MYRFVSMTLNWLMALLVVVVNICANILPINNISTAEVSVLYPNFFVLASYTSGIWFFIFALHILHVSYSAYMLASSARANSAVGVLVQKVNPWFWLSCLLNSAWVFAWHYQFIGISLLLMACLLFVLIMIFRILSISEKTLALGYFEHISIETPFIIYLSWINMVFLATASVYYTSCGGRFDDLQSVVACSCLIVLSTVVGVWMSMFWHRPAYTAVIVWGILGVYFQQAASQPIVGYVAVAAIVICLVAAVVGFWHKRKLLFVKSGQHY